MAFDVEGARKAGYSDAEIVDHLAGEAKFDTAGARKAGYSDADLLAHLVQPAQPTQPAAPLDDAAANAAARDTPPGTPISRIISSPEAIAADVPYTQAPADGPVQRVVGAAVEGFRNAPTFYAPEFHAQVDQGPVGRFITNPILDTATGVLGAIGAGAGQAAYETGAAIGGPRLGRDFNMINQVAPVTAIGAPRIPANRLLAPEPPPTVTAEAFPKMTRADYIDSFLSRQPPEVVADLAKTNPDAAAWLAQQQAAAKRQAVGAEISASGPEWTADKGKRVAGALYTTVDAANGALTPEYFDKFVDGIETKAPQTEAGKAVAGENATNKLVERLQPLRGKAMTLQAAQEVDEALSGLIDKEYGAKGLSKDGYNLLDIQRSFRDHIANAGAGDITGGTAGFEALSQARKAWSQAMKMDDLERIQRRAAMTDNEATSVKNQIGVLLRNESKVRGYSPEERVALQDAAERGTVGSLLHVFGSRLIPMLAGAAEMGTHGLTAGAATAVVTHLGTAKLRDWGGILQQNRLSNAINVVGQSVPTNLLMEPAPPFNY